MAPRPMRAPSQCERSTVAPSSTVQADSVVAGPMRQPDPIVVPASSEVSG